MKPRHKWTQQQSALLRELYPDTRTTDIAARMGIDIKLIYRKALRMGLRKSQEFFALDKSGRILKGGKLSVATQFVTGLVPWNKGRKGWQAGGRSVHTQFTTGMEPPNTRPIGTLRIITSNGGIKQLERKVSNASGPSHVRWKAVHRLVWEAAHGPVPHGHLVVFKPGMKTLVEAEITIDKVECITRAQNANRNHPKNKSPELAKLVQLKGAITRQVNRINKEHATS